MFYSKLVKNYIDYINPPLQYEELSSIDGPILWYMADHQKNIITTIGNNTNYIIDLDISSAFPTICNNLFDTNSEFIQKLNNIQDKKEKNIFIATNLKGDNLKQINKICKLIIVGIIFDTDNIDELNKINILELKKDGCLLTCSKQTIDRLTSLNYSNNIFTKFIIEHKFNFHIDYYAKYIRSSKTSFLLGKSLDINDFIIKGQYKYIPQKLFEIIFNTMLTGKIDKRNINKIYSEQFFKIIQKNNLKDYLKKYYLTTSNKIIDYNGKYINYNYNTIVYPEIYKRIFIYPTLLTNTIN